MRPPRLVLLAFCLIFLPIFLTFFSALSSSTHVATPNALAGPTTGLHALFSFNIPSSLFPPSAIISLTDDNSTFFLARPAAFGPLLPERGLSGQLWVGSGFGEAGAVTGVTGELGCSDIPGWGESDTHHNQDKTTWGMDNAGGKAGSTGDDRAVSQNLRRADFQHTSDLQSSGSDQGRSATNDGTDDHLHHPLPESGVTDTSTSEKRNEHSQIKPVAHADIQSLQESAEITGKIVLLSRGGCGFLEKVKWVQRRGGSALIVGDDTRGGGLVTMYARGDTSNVTIPSLFISHTTAQLLSSLIPPQSREEPSSASKSSSTRPSSHGAAGKQGSTVSTSAIPSPTASHSSIPEQPLRNSSKPKAGIFHMLLSLIGLGRNDGGTWPLAEDSRRPPSSGNIDWVVMNSWEEAENSLDEWKGSVGSSSSRSKASSISGGSKTLGSKSTSADGDGFVIGVQDWRDPDVMAPKSSVVSKPSSTLKSPSDGKAPNYAPTPSLDGGSRTPGSGEYQSIEETSNKESSAQILQSMDAAAQSATSVPDKGWFSRHFGWAEDKELDSDQFSTSEEQSSKEDPKALDSPISRNHQVVKSDEHEGLWVTLTPTSMSTSPFFDTILVLVVSPLLTLTVVYALLLIRSRIRRRRWRAPKSVVERLPVRTYHTIATSSSSSGSSPRSASPGLALPTSPLLGSGDRSGGSGTRPRSQTMSGIALGTTDPSKGETPKEKSGSGSTLWQRKYTGRQVECVVCLEEYVDGQSRVMSLPCGHEFHAECM